MIYELFDDAMAKDLEGTQKRKGPKFEGYPLGRFCIPSKYWELRGTQSG